ncbi:phosphatase [Thelephora ganbajun]|uniref:Phosphatase n=1 Tax=Thelephora ganbajun TaxID=370292 RepID=A0ACB6ZJM5_THEGA|nr:phosphatase [Thelephora ganbajun]
MPTTTVTFDAILFDMDGTLVDSTAGVTAAWEAIVREYPGEGLSVEEILSSTHGIRTVENLRRVCGIVDPDELEREAERFEMAIIEGAALGGGIVKLPGVEAIINDLAPGSTLPNPKWAICTSAKRKYATSALSAAGIKIPDIFVVAEDVKQGKPAPDPYILGAGKCGVKPERCLVVEDSPSGIKSGNTAGCKTLGLLTTHSPRQVVESSPDYTVKDLSSVSMKIVNGVVEVTISG